MLTAIINDLTSGAASLTEALLKTKVVAFRLRNQELLSWINNEHDGYANFDDVPEYRRVGCVTIGTISNGYQRASNFIIPIGHLATEDAEFWTSIKMNDGIPALIDLLERKQDSISTFLPPEIYGTLSKGLGNGFVVEQASRDINISQVAAIISTVRSKLLDFILALQNEIGESTEQAGIADISPQTVENLLNSAVFGNNTTIIVGSGNTQKVSNRHIVKNDFASLAAFLKQHKVEDADVDELQVALQEDGPPNSRTGFGIRVQGWMQKMFSKALNGTWEVSAGAAGQLLADAISQYTGG